MGTGPQYSVGTSLVTAESWDISSSEQKAARERPPRQRCPGHRSEKGARLRGSGVRKRQKRGSPKKEKTTYLLISYSRQLEPSCGAKAKQKYSVPIALCSSFGEYMLP